VPTFKVLNINILSDLALWEERRWLLVDGLSALKPDLIALQEVSIPENNARWLAHELEIQHVYLSPKSRKAGRKEGIAILSNLPFENQASLDLKTQHRVAQYVGVRVEGKPLYLANGHLFWQPGQSPGRQQQVDQLLGWLSSIPEDSPVIVCGDFNGTPETPAIRKMRQHFVSAYAAVHGEDPEYTTPTPLPRSKWKLLFTLLNFMRYIRLKDIDLHWRGTLDYIFVNQYLKVIDCQIVLNRPAPGNPNLYPSDHFGLLAILDFEK
jgi:endonuclease/exonuclease/phosphatase family metal-dependent hydrolase